MTTTPIAAVDLFAAALHIRTDGGVRAAGRRTVDGDPGTWHLATFHVETDADVHADHWEMHPEADEAVCCLAGGVRVFFRPVEDGAEEETVRLGAGNAVVVPRGRWHRLELDGPSDLMSITLRSGTRLERR
ncbi:cupin domain-containing protein [Kitasatospora sp. NPDC089797]|uniref:cupin domain-containing protein n=1 Tax=Kitasatospora sp. NPDC089797 TaxID=3155298 RepID=UPI00341F4CFC